MVNFSSSSTISTLKPHHFPTKPAPEVAGVAAFFGASTACAAFVNRVNDGIAAQLADFGSDLGLVVAWPRTSLGV